MKPLLIALACLGLTGCAGPAVQHYAAQQPTLDLVRYFEGKTTAWGMFQQRDGEVVKRFRVDLEGRFDGQKLVLREDFHYSDGSTQQRIWTLQRQADGRWRGTAADVVGEAIGEMAGNALNWRYRLRLPVDGTVYEVDFDDWMYLIDEQTLVNRASLRKFGIELGQVTLFFRRPASRE
ncbi:DUF3833 domain-containing protein [Parachitinimonas caeni]|uniref:DUF3833 domain-containing protein n=1 Tax=Parachitinimonas caeni TaxID=3031301 RepID=A0ABT7DXC8_9NEIS|nr:DUF3833 domain-containing protein [Parachitinimonas caeni]MDK2124729.1 DUF3833 domain-containing protein [Parachitinimonas caeni]